jgi:hypothetical protein
MTVAKLFADPKAYDSSASMEAAVAGCPFPLRNGSSKSGFAQLYDISDDRWTGIAAKIVQQSMPKYP